jgi:hypothetical protein
MAMAQAAKLFDSSGPWYSNLIVIIIIIKSFLIGRKMVL